MAPVLELPAPDAPQPFAQPARKEPTDHTRDHAQPSGAQSLFVRAASRSYYADLVAAGVRIFEYAGGLLHTKSVTLDGAITLIGSANMDPAQLRPEL